MEEFLATVCTPEWNAEFDRGRPFAEGVAELVERFPEQAALITAYHERWAEMVAGAIEGTVALVRGLRDAGVPVYALSNWSAETFPVGRRRFPFLDELDGLLVSGEVGLIKPDREIFDELRARFDLEPASTLFVDDSPANVEAAARLGFRTHHFRSPEALEAELVGLGLLPGS
jgi:2-haloacid dehalogenase